VDVKTTAEMIIYTAEKAIKDNEAKISADVKDGVNAKITALRGLKDGIDADAIKKATEELSNEMFKIGEAISKAAPDATATGAAPEEPNPSSTSGQATLRLTLFSQCKLEE